MKKYKDDPERRARCDQACKRVLAQKVILAWILKHCTEEFRDIDVKDIENKYIEGEPESDEFLRMLGVLFAEKISAAEKDKKLQTDFGIDMSDGMIDEVEKMCNLSYWYEEHGEERGIVKQKYASITNVMETLNTDFVSAANILKIPDAERDMYESLVLGKVKIEDIIKNID